MKNIYAQIPELSKNISPLVIATVIFTRGSAPQKSGSSALFSKNGLVEGTIGGGILEGKVGRVASEASISGTTGIFNFELDKSIEDKSEAICGGQVSVLIESGIEKYNRLFTEIDKHIEKRERCALLTIINRLTGNSLHIERYVATDINASDLPHQVKEKVEGDLRTLLQDNPDKGGFISKKFIDQGKDVLVLIEAIYPPPQLIIAGAGHIGRALHHIASLLGFEVTVIDNRAEFANPGNLPDASQIIVKEMSEALSTIEFAADTYVVIVTRGHNDDASALRACIGSKARYIGMIGSRTKIEKMRKNFIENGWATDEEWKAIHAPIGIEINSKTVEEIAISIAAELVLVRNSS